MRNDGGAQVGFVRQRASCRIERGEAAVSPPSGRWADPLIPSAGSEQALRCTQDDKGELRMTVHQLGGFLERSSEPPVGWLVFVGPVGSWMWRREYSAVGSHGAVPAGHANR